MKIFNVVTKGYCENGNALIVAKTEEKALAIYKEMINNLLENNGNYFNLPDNKLREPYEIVSIDEVDLNAEQIVYFDDGER